MTEVFPQLGSWRWLILSLLVFGFAPGAALRLIVLFYPKSHRRRRELVAELYAIPTAARPWWVAQQFETALFEGPPARLRERRGASVIVLASGETLTLRELVTMPSTGRPMRRRLTAASVAFALLFASVVVWLVAFNVRQGAMYNQYGISQRVRRVVLVSQRGRIVDRNGVVLAAPVLEPSVWTNPQLVTDPHAEALALASALGDDAQRLQERLSGEGRFVYIARRVGPAAAAKIRDLKLDGVFLLDEPGRTYPGGHFADVVIGSLGLDSVGLSGIERQYDEQLRGAAGSRVYERSPNGETIAGGVISFKPARDGLNVLTTLDHTFQRAADRASAALEALSAGSTAIVVVGDGTNGEILALARRGPAESDLERLAKEDQLLAPLWVDATATAAADQGVDPLSAPLIPALGALGAIATGGKYTVPSIVQSVGAGRAANVNKTRFDVTPSLALGHTAPAIVEGHEVFTRSGTRHGAARSIGYIATDTSVLTVVIELQGGDAGAEDLTRQAFRQLVTELIGAKP